MNLIFKERVGEFSYRDLPKIGRRPGLRPFRPFTGTKQLSPYLFCQLAPEL
jgi:hypothetical protein